MLQVLPGSDARWEAQRWVLADHYIDVLHWHGITSIHAASACHTRVENQHAMRFISKFTDSL